MFKESPVIKFATLFLFYSIVKKKQVWYLIVSFPGVYRLSYFNTLHVGKSTCFLSCVDPEVFVRVWAGEGA